MAEYNETVVRSEQSVLATNKVLRNTYALLGLTLLFSAFSAYMGMAIGLGFIASIVCSIAAIVLLWFVIPKTANSSMGLLVTFAFTGLLGAGLAPMLTHVLASPAGAGYVMQALGGTAIIFFALSAYAITTKKDFSFLSGMLVVGFMVVLVAIIANIFLAIPALSLAISAVIILLSSGFLLYDTGRIINGGETNYILATVSLYVSLYNIFVNLLSLIMAFSNDD